MKKKSYLFREKQKIEKTYQSKRFKIAENVILATNLLLDIKTWTILG